MSVMQHGDDFFNAVACAIQSQTKNRDKNQKRKNRAEKRKIEHDETEEPPTKKPKTKSNIIVTTPEQRKQLETIFHSTSIYNSAINLAGVFTSIDNSANYFYFYPLVLGPTRDSNGNVVKRTREKGKPFVKAQDYIPAAGNAAIIFTTLNKCFTKLFPDKDPTLIRKWDIYRWNIEYYGPKTAGHAPASQTYLAQLGNSRPFGGTSASRTVHLIRDIKVGRFKCAIHVNDFFEGRKKKDLHCVVPEDASVATVDILHKIEESIKEQKKAEAEAESDITKLTKTAGFAEKVDYDSESDYDSDSD